MTIYFRQFSGIAIYGQNYCVREKQIFHRKVNKIKHAEEFPIPHSLFTALQLNSPENTLIRFDTLFAAKSFRCSLFSSYHCSSAEGNAHSLYSILPFVIVLQIKKSKKNIMTWYPISYVRWAFPRTDSNSCLSNVSWLQQCSFGQHFCHQSTYVLYCVIKFKILKYKIEYFIFENILLLCLYILVT